MSNNKIMIVEDEEVVAADIRMSVETMGYDVCATVSSGLEAIQKAESTRPDLILMDINLKGNMDGIVAATRIKDLYQIPVVYLTSFGDDAMLQQAKVAEPYGYITKPFVDRDLHIAIEISIYKKQAEEENAKLKGQLRQARKMESIGILAGGLAHDFNNLLYVMMGNISLAQDDLKLESETSANLKKAEKACIKAKELTARLITFSKGGDPVKKMMPINDLLKDMVDSALSGSDITPEIFISEDIRQVNIDEYQIKEVIRNIVVNAKEAMDDNGQLDVSCENIDIAEEGHLTLSQGEYIKISFEDHGCGISKENLEKIFDPYFSTKNMGAVKGQGLGLAICYSIIQKHKGLITVESEPQTGSTFSIYLPAFLVKESDFIKEPGLQKSEEKPAVQKPAAQKTTAQKTTAQLVQQLVKQPVKRPATNKGKILVMDDEEMIRTFMGQMLSRSGYDVETCIEGKEAVEIYKKAMDLKKPFDVVILDLTNKIGMGGQKAMRKLLEIDHNAKGIIITGYSDDPVVANFRAYGFSGFITKPATRNELSKVINEVAPYN